MNNSKVTLYRLFIHNLYGCYDYDIKFNSDLTLLYGSNGCGKTTILNILENIVTGNIADLFKYSFKCIELSYAVSLCVHTIHIKRKSNNNIELHYVGTEKVIAITPNSKAIQAIKEIFSHIYLPTKHHFSDTNKAKIKLSNRKKKLLLDTLNNFFGSGYMKKVQFNKTGGISVYSTMNGDTIPFSKLSSGEQQVFRFFNTLVGTGYSILLMDNIETFLHISWQRNFIDSVLKVHRNAQFIFATHSPAIITGHEKNAVLVSALTEKRD